VPKVDPSDPGAGTLLGLGDRAAAAVVETLTAGLAYRSVPASTEVVVRLARAQLDTGAPSEAAATLDRLGDQRDWRLWWHRGLVALAEGRPQQAVDWLDPTYTDLPGEIAPRLALAVAAEAGGDLERAEELYARVSTIDPGYVSAAFGLGRVRLARGDRAGAVDAFGRVPPSSSARAAAEVARVRALIGGDGGGGVVVAIDDLARASLTLEQLELDPGRRAELARDVFRAALAAVAHGARDGRVVVLGRRLDEKELRRGLESTYRELARAAPTRADQVHLVDEANRSRPRTLL
jgi:serine/threonine-protein kinase PknG